MPGRSDPSNKGDNNGNQQECDEQEEQDLRYACRCAGYAAKTQNAGNQRNNQEDESVI